MRSEQAAENYWRDHFYDDCMSSMISTLGLSADDELRSFVSLFVSMFGAEVNYDALMMDVECYRRNNNGHVPGLLLLQRSYFGDGVLSC